MQKYGYKNLLQKNDQIKFDFGKIIVSFEILFIIIAFNQRRNAIG